MWHINDECQVCDMFENIGYWGPPTVPEPHHIVYYPDEPEAASLDGIIRDQHGEPVCVCTYGERCEGCRASDTGS